MKFKKHDWLDTKTRTPRYGIDVDLEDGRGWHHACEGRDPLLFEDEWYRDIKLRRLRREAAREALQVD